MPGRCLSEVYVLRIKCGLYGGGDGALLTGLLKAGGIHVGAHPAAGNEVGTLDNGTVQKLSHFHLVVALNRGQVLAVYARSLQASLKPASARLQAAPPVIRATK